MGTGFSIDTPVKVAHYGITSVISLCDDVLIENMRKHYCMVTGEEYIPITKEENDFRAKRITAYLNLVHRIVQKQFSELKTSPFQPGSEITKYFRLLPDDCELKKLYQTMLKTDDATEKEKIQTTLRESIRPGEINVNVMTKLDRPNYQKDGTELPSEFSDALAALRGYAQSSLTSAIEFSAGINRRLYSYAEEFKDFYADAAGNIKKKIILKVSDFRSSIIQGKFFAKKGLWISEFRIESGLNCGGHVFPTDGFLMGPILEEFRTKKAELTETLHKICNEALKIKNKVCLTKVPELKITAQGGIGTYNENKFLLDQYKLDFTGLATPFLLVPEVTNVDPETLKKLSSAKEQDLYVSDVSPLGVSFNNLKNSVADLERDRKILKGRPGSACPKGYLVSNREFTKEPICTASRLYQKLKIDQLSKLQLSLQAYKKRFEEIVVKSCICNDLGEPALIKIGEGDPTKRFTAVCPGPNIAYFSKISTLQEMVDHIYGRTNLLDPVYRPHMFIKELKMYIEYFIKEAQKCLIEPTEIQRKYFIDFRNNLLNGIEYYRGLFPQIALERMEFRTKMLEELEAFRTKLEEFVEQNAHFFMTTQTDAEPAVS